MEEVSLKSFLGSFSLFENFNDNELDLISNYFQLETFPKGVTILKQGDSGENIFLIKSGKVNVSLRKPGDVNLTIGEIGEGEFFGEVSMFSGGPIIASIHTLEDTTCYKFARNNLDLLRNLDLALATKIEHSIAVSSAQKIIHLLKLLRELYSHSQETKSVGHRGLPVLVLPFKPNPAAKSQRISDFKFNFSRLREMEILSEFSDDEIQILLKYPTVIQCEKGYPLTAKDNHLSECAIVYSGALQEHGKVLPKLSIVEPGQMYGELSIILEDHGIFSAMARENSVILSFSEDDISKMHAENFELWAKFHRVICLEVINFLYNADRQMLRFEAESKDF